MNNDERLQRYAMMGVVAYVQERIISFEKAAHKLPALVVLGEMEWKQILRCKDDEEFTIAGIPCVPDLTKPCGAHLVS